MTSPVQVQPCQPSPYSGRNVSRFRTGSTHSYIFLERALTFFTFFKKAVMPMTLTLRPWIIQQVRSFETYRQATLNVVDLRQMCHTKSTTCVPFRHIYREREPESENSLCWAGEASAGEQKCQCIIFQNEGSQNLNAENVQALKFLHWKPRKGLAESPARGGHRRSFVGKAVWRCIGPDCWTFAVAKGGATRNALHFSLSGNHTKMHKFRSCTFQSTTTGFQWLPQQDFICVHFLIIDRHSFTPVKEQIARILHCQPTKEIKLAKFPRMSTCTLPSCHLCPQPVDTTACGHPKLSVHNSLSFLSKFPHSYQTQVKAKHFLKQRLF